MSVITSYGTEEIKISNEESLLLEKMEEEGYSWVEVTFKDNSGHSYMVGSYYTYDYGISRGWMKYNTETIAIAKEYIPTDSSEDIQIETLFDIKTKLFIEGSKEDLLEYYNQQFSSENQNAVNNVCFQRKLMIKKN